VVVCDDDGGVAKSSTAEHAWRQKKTFIYTSGILVYGDHPGEVVDETTPIPPYPMVQWRIDHEKQVVGQDKLNGVVIRPGFVYGHSGSLSAPLFKAAGDTLVIKGPLVRWSVGSLVRSLLAERETLATRTGKREKRWSWVHVEDLAQAYVLAVQKIHVAKGEVFNIVSPSSPTWEELNLSAAKLVGFTGKVDYQVRACASHVHCARSQAIESKLFSLGFALLVLFVHTRSLRVTSGGTTLWM